MDVAVIQANAMKLKESDRTILADRLLHSITPVSDTIRSAWKVEVASRLDAFRAGEIEAVDGSAAMEGLLDRFAE